MSGDQFAAGLAPRIREILSGADLETVTAKKVRKQLIADGQPENVVKQNREALDAVIERIYHSMTGAGASDESEEEGKPLASTSTPARSSAAAVAASSPAVPLYRYAPGTSENGSNKVNKSSSTKPKPKSKPSVARIEEDGDDSDEAFARALQAELDGLDGKRGTRGGAKSKSSSSKKRKSAAILSDGESGDESKRRKSGGSNAFMREMLLDDALAAFVGKPRESRPQVVKRIWDHVKANNLQDPADKRQILCDPPLRAVFGVDKVHMFTMNKLLSSHLYKPDEVVDGNIKADP